MSVIVKGMVIPNTCEECQVSCEVGSDLHCQVTDDGNKWGWKKSENGFESRPDWCPLSPMPEKHGRLIDGDELAAGCDAPHWCRRLSEIEDMPTIVEAEE